MKISRWLPDVLLLLGLALYIIGGMDQTPFHGDEATVITTSQDYYYAVQSHDFDAVVYHDHPYDASMQELRIINGTIARYTIGFTWDMAGMTVHDLNDQWVWEWSMDQNKALGHMPSAHLLHIARWPATIFTVLTVLLLYVITRLAANRPAAWVASFLYATHPGVLINGRRAMMEGSLMFFSVLVILLAILALRRKHLFGWCLAVGLGAGLAVSSKHNGGVPAAAAFLAVAFAPFLVGWGAVPRAQFFRRVGYLLIAGLLAVLTFFAINPAWWSDPLGMPSRVLDARTKLLDGQIAFYGGLDSPGERIQALFNQAFFEEPQYYEVGVWQEYIGDEIHDYERSGFAGRDGSFLDRLGLLSREDALLGWGVLIAALFSFGLVDLAARFRQPDQTAAWVVLVWLIITIIGLLGLIPLDWQRYYVPLQAPLSVIAGVGAWRIGTLVWKRGTHAPV